jgi:hypothetical protein
MVTKWGFRHIESPDLQPHADMREEKAFSYSVVQGHYMIVYAGIGSAERHVEFARRRPKWGIS